MCVEPQGRRAVPAARDVRRRRRPRRSARPRKKTGGCCIVATAKRDGGGVRRRDGREAAGDRDRQRPSMPAAARRRGRRVDLPLAILEQFIGKQIARWRRSHDAAPRRARRRRRRPTATSRCCGRGCASAFVGDSQLAVEPITLPGGKPGVSIQGTRARGPARRSSGTLGTTAPFPVELAVTRPPRSSSTSLLDLTEAARPRRAAAGVGRRARSP